MSASNIRQELADYHIYLTLILALIEKSGNQYEQLQEMMRTVASFIDDATSRKIKEQGKQILQMLKQAVDRDPNSLRRRMPLRLIARDFQELCRQTDVWRNGIPYGWLQERFIMQGFLLYSDFPCHAKVGIGIHSGRASVEEIFLLEDTYFLLVQAEGAFDQMQAAANLLQDSRGKLHSSSGDYEALSAINAKVGTFSRLAVISAAAFVEAFVNSVGWSESVRGLHRSEEVRNQLKGITQKGRYLSLETKLEKFPKLIRADGITPIILSDAKQAEEPFVSFLAETKEIRDASMHYAPGKAMIWRPPHDWYASAKRAVECAVGVAGSFWLACYPQKELPRYLNSLSHAALLEIARQRAKQGNCASRNESE